jgi:hypothetical protein
MTYCLSLPPAAIRLADFADYFGALSRIITAIESITDEKYLSLLAYLASFLVLGGLKAKIAVAFSMARPQLHSRRHS